MAISRNACPCMFDSADQLDRAFKGEATAIAMIADMHHAPASGTIPVQYVQFSDNVVDVGWPALGHRSTSVSFQWVSIVLLNAGQKDTKRPCSVLAPFLAVDYNGHYPSVGQLRIRRRREAA